MIRSTSAEAIGTKRRPYRTLASGVALATAMSLAGCGGSKEGEVAQAPTASSRTEAAAQAPSQSKELLRTVGHFSVRCTDTDETVPQIVKVSLPGNLPPDAGVTGPAGGEITLGCGPDGKAPQVFEDITDGGACTGYKFGESYLKLEADSQKTPAFDITPDADGKFVRISFNPSNNAPENEVVTLASLSLTHRNEADQYKNREEYAAHHCAASLPPAPGQ